MEPSAWAHRTNQFKEGDTIRVTGQRREFDTVLVVLAKAPGGLVHEHLPVPGRRHRVSGILMRGVTTQQTLTKTELAAEIKAPIEPPAISKKTRAA